VKSDPTFWILARASGLLAYALLTASVLAGLVLKARPLGTALKPATVTDLHRFLSLLGLGALSLHGLALLFDTAVPISLADLMLLIHASFSLRKRIGTRNWRRLHWVTYVVFALATVHGLAAGTDSGTTWALALYGAATGAVLAATAWRALIPPARRITRVPDRDRPLPV